MSSIFIFPGLHFLVQVSFSICRCKLNFFFPDVDSKRVDELVKKIRCHRCFGWFTQNTAWNSESIPYIRKPATPDSDVLLVKTSPSKKALLYSQPAFSELECGSTKPHLDESNHGGQQIEQKHKIAHFDEPTNSSCWFNGQIISFKTRINWRKCYWNIKWIYSHIDVSLLYMKFVLLLAKWWLTICSRYSFGCICSS